MGFSGHWKVRKTCLVCFRFLGVLVVIFVGFCLQKEKTSN